MKIKRESLNRLIDAIADTRFNLTTSEGLKIGPVEAPGSTYEACALGMLTILYGITVTPDDVVELSGFCVVGGLK